MVMRKRRFEMWMHRTIPHLSKQDILSGLKWRVILGGRVLSGLIPSRRSFAEGKDTGWSTTFISSASLRQGAGSVWSEWLRDELPCRVKRGNLGIWGNLTHLPDLKRYLHTYSTDQWQTPPHSSRLSMFRGTWFE